MSKRYYEEDLNTGELVPVTDRVVVLQPGDEVRRKKQIEHNSLSANIGTIQAVPHL